MENQPLATGFLLFTFFFWFFPLFSGSLLNSLQVFRCCTQSAFQNPVPCLYPGSPGQPTRQVCYPCQPKGPFSPQKYAQVGLASLWFLSTKLKSVNLPWPSPWEVLLGPTVASSCSSLGRGATRPPAGGSSTHQRTWALPWVYLGYILTALGLEVWLDTCYWVGCKEVFFPLFFLLFFLGPCWSKSQDIKRTPEFSRLLGWIFRLTFWLKSRCVFHWTPPTS